MISGSGDGYTLLLIHTWILYAVPIAIAVVAFVIGRLSKYTGPRETEANPGERDDIAARLRADWKEWSDSVSQRGKDWKEWSDSVSQHPKNDRRKS
jgi:hypothetical protein